MWLEIFTIPFVLTLIVFIIFWIVKDGQRWQKHPYLGAFARIIQKSPSRAFFTFFGLMILLIPLALLVMTGMWWDKLNAGLTPERTDVVNVMLIMFLVLCFTIYIAWGAYGTWRNAMRAEAEVKVRPV
jgi:multisubunit Na+/H+ antiporter MnhB subunit